MEPFFQTELILFLRLLAAHLVADFILQPSGWIKNRRDRGIKSPYLYFHGLIIGIVTYLFWAQWSHPLIPVIIMVTHIMIDMWKSGKPETARYFVIDQSFHVLILLICWIIYPGGPLHGIYLIGMVGGHTLANGRFWTLLVGYIAVIWPSGYFVSFATQRWRKDIRSENETDFQGLEDAGKWIGRIERILILTFILFNQISAIGFLIASKSVFRFGEIRDRKYRKEAEYILIGTLISFTVAIGIGIIIRSFYNLF